MGVRHYTLKITTVGPVHIGNGNKLGKKDYFARGKSVAVLDVQAFASRLSAHQLSEYITFLSDSSNRVTLQGFFDRHPDMRKIGEQSIAYLIHMQLERARRGNYLYHDVAECIKDPYGNPYIPGSSVKGMLRTALLASVLDEQKAKYVRLYDKNAVQSGSRSTWLRACSRIEAAVFCRETPDPHSPEVTNDVMRYVSIADSAPLSPSDLVFAKKYDRFSRLDDGRHKRDMGKLSDDDYWGGNSLDIYRECIRPGLTIEFAIDIDERIDEYFGSFDAAFLRNVFEHAQTLYTSRFLSHFDIDERSDAISSDASVGDGRCQYIYESGPLKGMRCRNRAIGGIGYCNIHKDKAPVQSAGSMRRVSCYLGGGVGFSNKTIVHALLADQRERTDVIARTLYAQFPTTMDRDIHTDLWYDVRRAGFSPRDVPARYIKGRLVRGKNDHRHWMDSEFGVSPHTAKLAIVDGRTYQMGKCLLEIKE